MFVPNQSETPAATPVLTVVDLDGFADLDTMPLDAVRDLDGPPPPAPAPPAAPAPAAGPTGFSLVRRVSE